MSKRQVIRTLDELEALPIDSVVIDEDAAAYQRDGRRSWSGNGRLWDTQQIALPVVILHRGGDAIDEFTKENN